MNVLIWMVVLTVGLYTVAEIWLLLALGEVLGVFVTMIWMLFSMVAGVILLRLQGIGTLLRIHRQLLNEVVPTKELLDMSLILLGGFLLIAPGFLSDFMGLCLLLPPARWMLRHPLLMLVQRLFPATRPAEQEPAGGAVIEIQADGDPP